MSNPNNDITQKRMYFCENLRTFRINRKLSQVDMAKRFNITQSTYSHYELDRIPPHDILIELSRMGLDLSQSFVCSPEMINSKQIEESPYITITNLFNQIMNDESGDPVAKFLLFDLLKERFNTWNNDRLRNAKIR